MKHLHKLEVELEAILRGKRGVMPSLYRAAMTPFAWGYGAVVKSRNHFYNKRGGVKVSVPVVSVGNIVVGGTGKSDVVAALAEALPGRVAIISRGYGVKITKPFVVQPHHGAEKCGDEPRMLASRLKNVIVVVGPDRVTAARLAIGKGADILLLDDGMQHRNLHRDFEVVVVDGSNPLGRNHFLPKGLLRDDPKRLKEANLVIVTGGEEALPPSAVRMRGQVEGVFTLMGEKIETLRGVGVALFCGIGNPERFVKTVTELGAEIRGKLFLPDHTGVEEAQLANLLVASGASYLVCTEKDRVKLKKSSLPILWIKRRLVVDENAECWQNALAKIGMMI